MMTHKKHFSSLFPAGVMLSLLVASCASIGNPSGGPRDEEPPRFVRSNPAPGALNFSGDRVTLYFDEIVNVKDAFSKVSVSPPSDQTPRVSSQGHRVIVDFRDTLLPNTTYTIDFADAIEDNNEQNPLQGFSFSFSTGETIDSLRVSGMVLSADESEPLQQKPVGVFRAPEGGGLKALDSLFRTRRFDRMARTDDRGRFSIAGLAAGDYYVVALDDQDADFKFSSPEEEIAFYPVTVSPYTEQDEVSDTIFDFKTGTVDTVVSRQRTLFLPNNILLRSSKSNFKQQYLAKYERIDTTRLSFIFNSRSLQPATYSIVGAPGLKDWAVEERSRGNDSVTLWIRPLSLVSADTLRIAANYLRTDSTMNLSEFSDTLRFTFDRAKHLRTLAQAEKDKKKQMEAALRRGDSTVLVEKTPLLAINMLTQATQDVNRPIIFETGTPLDSLDPSAFHLEWKKDTVWKPLKTPAPVMTDSLQPRRFTIEYPWKYDTQYRFTVDSLAVRGIYGLYNGPLTHEFKTRAESDYGTITLRPSGIEPGVASFIELLNGDKVVAREPVKDGAAVFEYLQPGKYYARIYEDWNGNGEYDPGDLAKGEQPDMAYYYPKIINLKKNWSKDEAWDVFSVAIDLQKPQQILKNKPKQKKGQKVPGAKNDEDDEDEDEEDEE